MLRSRRLPVLRSLGIITSSSAIFTLSGALVPALAQSTDAPPAVEDTVSLPPVVVESTQTQPKANKKKSASSKKKAPAVSQPAPQVETAVQGAGGQGERANGPVNGYSATQSATATKTDTPILETPQAISVVTQDQIRAQQAQTVREALNYTPGVSVDGFGAGVFFDWIKIRGFNAPQYLDGLAVPTDSVAFAVPRIEPYGLERIEVLKGPSSGLYGQSNPGGLINMVSKRPLWTEHAEMQATLGSFNQREAAFDFGGRVAGAEGVVYRLVGLGRIGDSEVDFVKNDKVFIAPSLAWRVTDDTTITLLSHYQRNHSDNYQQYVPGQGTLLPNPNGRLPRSRYLGVPGADELTLEQASVGYALEHRFNGALQFRQNLRYMGVENDTIATRGDAVIADSILMRMPLVVDAQSRAFTVDNQLQADIATGALQHQVLFGLDYQKNRSANRTLAGSYIPLDMYNPDYSAYPFPPTAFMFPFLDVHASLEQTGIYLQDQIKWDRFTLSLTGRQDWTRVETISTAAFPLPGVYEREDSARTGRVGLSYLFDFGLAPYINYSTSFTPNIGASPTGEGFKPTTGEGKEIGIKYMAPGTNLMFTAALFDIRQNDVLTSYPGNPLLSVQTDAVRVRGYEFEVRGNVTRELEIIGGYSKLDPKITESAYPVTIGNYMPNVNLETASLWAKYTWYDGPLRGLGIGAGVRYLGENYGDNANSIYIPSYTLYDATVSYDLAALRAGLDGWQAQINATNLTDEYYVTSCQAGITWCGLGAGRTILGTLKYTWDATSR